MTAIIKSGEQWFKEQQEERAARVAPPLKVALYARVSTFKQDELNQIPILTAYAEHRGYTVFKIYNDVASGADPNRPAWRELMADAHRHRFDCVVALRLDRIMRSVAHLHKVIEELKADKIKIELTDIGRLDYDTATGQLLINFLAAISAWELGIIRERTRQILAEKRKQGIIGGRPRKDIDIDTAARLRLAGHSIKKTAEKLNCTPSDLNNRRALIWARMDEIKAEEKNKGGEE